MLSSCLIVSLIISVCSCSCMCKVVHSDLHMQIYSMSKWVHSEFPPVLSFNCSALLRIWMLILAHNNCFEGSRWTQSSRPPQPLEVNVLRPLTMIEFGGAVCLAMQPDTIAFSHQKKYSAVPRTSCWKYHLFGMFAPCARENHCYRNTFWTNVAPWLAKSIPPETPTPDIFKRQGNWEEGQQVQTFKVWSKFNIIWRHQAKSKKEKKTALGFTLCGKAVAYELKQDYNKWIRLQNKQVASERESLSNTSLRIWLHPLQGVPYFTTHSHK